MRKLWVQIDDHMRFSGTKYAKGNNTYRRNHYNVVSHCGKSYFLLFLRGSYSQSPPTQFFSSQFMAHCLYSWLILDGRTVTRVPVRGAGHPGGYALAAAIQVAVNAR